MTYDEAVKLLLRTSTPIRRRGWKLNNKLYLLPGSNSAAQQIYDLLPPGHYIKRKADIVAGTQRSIVLVSCHKDDALILKPYHPTLVDVSAEDWEVVTPHKQPC